MGLRVLLLGPIEVWTGGDAVQLGRRERAVVALLALQPGRMLTSAQLIADLWNDAPPDTATTALQGYISRIRRALGAGAIRTFEAGYAIEASTDDVDVFVFERLADEGLRLLREERVHQAARVLRRALALWRGVPLAELADVPAAAARAVRLEERRLVVLEHRLQADLSRGDASIILDEVAELVREHALQERPVELLMTALSQLGRRDEALGAYTAFRQRSADELGLEPTAKLQQMQESLLRGDTLGAVSALAVASTVRRPPVPTSVLVGRSTAMRELRELVSSPAVRLVTLIGPGGTGKTRLANEAARAIAGDYEDGACWVGLAGVGERADILPAIAQALGIVDLPDRSMHVAVGERLSRREVLMVFDNAEHLLPDLALLLSDLLAAGAIAPFMVTSRVALRIRGEHRYVVSPLELTGKGAATEAIDESPARELFLQRARSVRPGLHLTQEASEAVNLICRRLDGLPLALELAAARCAVLSLPALADRLERRLSLLTTGTSDATPHHTSLRAALEWSYRLLDSDQQAVLCRLAIARGGADLTDVTLIADHDASIGDRVLEIVEQLADASMISIAHDASGSSRLVMLETVREYASERLRDDPEAERLAARGLARYCLAFLPRHIPPYPSDVHQARRLSAEQDNLRTALRWARHDGDPELLCQLSIGFAGSAGLVVTPGEAEDWLLRAQEFAEGTSFGTALLVMRAIAAGASGRFDRGAQLLEALPAKDAQNPAWYAAGLGSKALLMSLTGGAAEDVRTTAQLSVDAAREHGDATTLAFTLNNAGGAVAETDPQSAVALLEEAVALARDTNDLLHTVAATNLAETALSTGSTALARRWASEAVNVSLSAVPPGIRAYSLDLLGAALLLDGKLADAEKLLHQACEHALWADDPTIISEVMPRFAVLASQRGERDRARRLLIEYAATELDIGTFVSGSNRLLLRERLQDLPEAQHIIEGDLQTVAVRAIRPPRDHLLRWAYGDEPAPGPTADNEADYRRLYP